MVTISNADSEDEVLVTYDTPRLSHMRHNFEILIPEVDSRYTTICSVDGSGEINNNKFVVITPMVITK